MDSDNDITSYFTTKKQKFQIVRKTGMIDRKKRFLLKRGLRRGKDFEEEERGAAAEEGREGDNLIEISEYLKGSHLQNIRLW